MSAVGVAEASTRRARVPIPAILVTLASFGGMLAQGRVDPAALRPPSLVDPRLWVEAGVAAVALGGALLLRRQAGWSATATIVAPLLLVAGLADARWIPVFFLAAAGAQAVGKRLATHMLASALPLAALVLAGALPVAGAAALVLPGLFADDLRRDPNARASLVRFVALVGALYLAIHIALAPWGFRGGLFAHVSSAWFTWGG